MAVSRLKEWAVGDTLTDTDLEAEFDNIYNAGVSLISPLTGNLDCNAKSLNNIGATASTMIYLDASKNLTPTTAPTNGQLLVGSTGAVPALATLTAGYGIGVTNAAASITLAMSPEYGVISRNNNGALTVINSQGVYEQVTIFDTIGVASGITADVTEDHLLISTTGIYLVGYSASIIGTNADTISMHIERNNGMEAFGGTDTKTTYTATPDILPLTTSAIVSLTAADTVELWVANETDADDVTIADVVLWALRIA